MDIGVPNPQNVQRRSLQRDLHEVGEWWRAVRINGGAHTKKCISICFGDEIWARALQYGCAKKAGAQRRRQRLRGVGLAEKIVATRDPGRTGP